MSSRLDVLKKYKNFLEDNETFSSVKIMEQKFTEKGKEASEINTNNLSSEEGWEIFEIAQLVLHRRKTAYSNLIISWNKGNTLPDSREKELLKKYKEKIIEEHENLISLAKLLFSPTSSKLTELISYVENSKHDASENIKILDKLLDEGNAPPHLQNQINNLQARLSSLENKTDKSSQEKKEITQLKKQITDLQQQLNNSNTSPPSPSKDTPWGLIIGGGLVIGTLLIAIVILVRKNKRLKR